jgi:hypothetical protein
VPSPTVRLCLSSGCRLCHGCAELDDGGLENFDLHVILPGARGLGGLSPYCRSALLQSGRLTAWATPKRAQRR